MNAAYVELKPYGLARDYYLEITSKIELLAIASQLNSLVKAYEQNGEKGFSEQLPKVKTKLNDIYGEYNAEVDRRLFRSLMEMYIKDQPEEYVAPMAKKEWTDQNSHDPGITILEALCYNISDLSSADKIKRRLEGDQQTVMAAIKKRFGGLIVPGYGKNLQ